MLSLAAASLIESQSDRLTMDPHWCYGKQGPLYLVACAINGSVYRHEAEQVDR